MAIVGVLPGLFRFSGSTEDRSLSPLPGKVKIARPGAIIHDQVTGAYDLYRALAEAFISAVVGDYRVVQK